MSRRGWLGAALVSAAIAGVVLAVILPRESGTSGGPTPSVVTTQTIAAVLTAADVKNAFADQGLSLAGYEIGPGIPALGYPVGAEGTGAMRIACLIFDFPVMARGYVKTMHEKRPGNVSRALRAKNVAVLILPAATPDDVRRTLSAVAQLRRR